MNGLTREQLAANLVTCPLCGSKPGDDCRMPSGSKLHRPYRRPHVERVELASASPHGTTVSK